jgi:XTP/dITP diphosphohydrolase
MIEILVATHNHKKRSELRALLKEFRKVRVLDLDDLDVAPPNVIEDGKTFRQNAVKKAVTVSKFFKGLVLADDSGLEVEELDGKPGVRSARFARAKATDEENNKKLLKLLEDVPEKARKARFVCNIALAKKGSLLANFEGVTKGSIALKPKGENGFGYDPLFIPDNRKRTFAQMTAAYKNKISHRGKALKKLKSSIGKYIDK